MCYNCGKIMNPLWGTNLQSMFETAENGDNAAKVGRYKAILESLQKHGGCGSCISMISEKVRTTFY